MTANFVSLDTGFSILKCGDHYNLNYPVIENGEEFRKFLSFDSFNEALKHYQEMIQDEQTN